MARSKKEIAEIHSVLKTAYQSEFGQEVKSQVLTNGAYKLLEQREAKFFAKRLDHLSDADLTEFFNQCIDPYVEVIPHIVKKDNGQRSEERKNIIQAPIHRKKN